MGALEASRLHEPFLPNVLGHAAGTLIFAIFVALVLRDRSGQGSRSRNLSLAAAAMALIWNAGSLWILLASPGSAGAAWLLTAISTVALSLLPAFLLDLLLAGSKRKVAWAGYALSALASALHFGENVGGGMALHRNTLSLTAAGFALLATVGIVLPWRGISKSIGAMALFLLALSFSHFSQEEAHTGWLIEVIVHHAGLPLALFVLMQDYRFVLLDAFLRFLANILLAAVFALAGLRLAAWAGWFNWRTADPLALSLALIATAVALVLFAIARQAAQALLTRLLFRPRNAEELLTSLRNAPVRDETGFLDWAAGEIARFFDARAVEGETAEASIPIRLPEGATRVFGLTRRAGGRRYLSEDHELLGSFATEISLRVERFREQELRRLVSDAELRALQSQIHPHFLFNALNALYGVIPKEARGARDTVLNLADVLRYFLRTGGQAIPLEEEVRIVRAYLAIERLRLGDKLSVEIDLQPEAAAAMIPVLSIQPLVENAIKHGIALNPAGGMVRLAVRSREGRLDVKVENTPAPAGAAVAHGAGIGLENVRQRLRLHYGESGHLTLNLEGETTVAGFEAPLEAAR
jgi:hypothetical protein